MIEDFKARFSINDFTGEMFFQWFFKYRNRMYGETKILGFYNQLRDTSFLDGIQLKCLNDMLNFIEKLVHSNEEEKRCLKRLKNTFRRKKMPKGVVKTKADEKKWKKAKKAVGSKYKGKTKWKVVNSVFQKMKGK